MGFLKLLVSPITNLANTWMHNKAEEKQALHERKITVIKNDANWEETMAKASGSSWKDEYWTIVLSIPVWIVMYAIAINNPDIIVRVELGFEALENLPEWFQYLLFIAISSSFGIRGVSKLMELRK